MLKTRARNGRVPEMRDRSANEDFDKHTNDIVQSHETYESIDECYGTTIWRKDASDKQKNGEFGEECGWAI